MHHRDSAGTSDHAGYRHIGLKRCLWAMPPSGLIGRGDRQITVDALTLASWTKHEAEPQRLVADGGHPAHLTRMTTELAGAILDWRFNDGQKVEAQRTISGSTCYRRKNGPFESVDELRLVCGYLDTLYGEDAFEWPARPEQTGVFLRQ